MRKLTRPLVLIAFCLGVVIAQVPGGGNRYGLPPRYGSQFGFAGAPNTVGRPNSAGVNSNPNSRIFGLLGGGGGGGGLFGGLLSNLLGGGNRYPPPQPYPVYGGGFPGYGGFGGYPGFGGFGGYPGFGGGFAG